MCSGTTTWVGRSRSTLVDFLVLQNPRGSGQRHDADDSILLYCKRGDRNVLEGAIIQPVITPTLSLLPCTSLLSSLRTACTSCALWETLIGKGDLYLQTDLRYCIKGRSGV